MKKMICLFSTLLLTITIVWAQTRTITGTVSNKESGEPLSGASIIIAGQSSGTTILDERARNFLVSRSAGSI